MKEIKCDICGTINDGSTNFCKGCFQKLDAERKQNVVEEEKKIVNVIQTEEVRDVPWNNDEAVEEKVDNNIPEIENWELVSVNADSKPKVSAEEESKVVRELVDPSGEATAQEQPAENSDDSNLDFKMPEIKEENKELEIPVAADEPATEEVTETPVEEVQEVTEEAVETVESVDNTAEEAISELPETNPDNVPTDWAMPEDPEKILEPLEKIEDGEVPVEETTESVEPIPVSEQVEESQIEEIIEPIAELSEESEPVKTEDTTDDWSKDPVEEPTLTEKEPNYIIKFLIFNVASMVIIFGILLFLEKFLNNVFDNGTKDIVSFAIYRLASLMILIMAAKLTFSKKVPKIERLNEVTFKMLGYVAIPSIIVELFILGFVKNTTTLMFVAGVMLSLIILVIFFSYVRNTIKKRNSVHIEDKVFFIYGIINIVLIIVCLGFGIYARSNKIELPKINFLYDLFNDNSADINVVQSFIDKVETRVSDYQVKVKDYKIPSSIVNTDFAQHDGYIPDRIDLKLDEDGKVIQGTIEYRGITYTYDGKKIKAM